MSIDITQQALNALADAGLGNDSPAEAYVIGYTQGHDDALALAIQLERSINRRPFMPDEAERLAMRLHEQVGDCPIAHESGKAMDEFIGMLDEYMVWYRDRRIKTEFGMSIMDRRRGLGLVA